MEYGNSSRAQESKVSVMKQDNRLAREVRTKRTVQKIRRNDADEARRDECGAGMF